MKTLTNAAICFCVFLLPVLLHMATGFDVIIAAQAGLLVGISVTLALSPSKARHFTAPVALVYISPLIYAVAYVSHWYAISVFVIAGCFWICDLTKR